MEFVGNSFQKDFDLRFIQLFDRFGFFIAFIFGLVGIVGMKAFNVTQWIITVYAVAVMLLYSAVIFLSPRLRLREDQAGDNIYYLGLLFTLISLAWALWIFTPEAGAKQVIGSFGIALATTIVGLALRVFFNQMRQDLIEIEREARLELAEAANRVRTSLDQIVLDMSDFHRTTQQATAESHINAAELIQKVTNKSIEDLNGITLHVTEKIGQCFEGLNGYANRLTSAADSIVFTLEKHASTLDGITENTKSVDNQIGTLLTVALEAEKGLNTLTKKTTEIRGIHASMKEIASTSKQLVDDQAISLAELRETLANFSSNVMSIASKWESTEAEALSGIIARRSSAHAELEKEIQQLRQTQMEALKSFSDSLQANAKVISEHSGALAEQLDKKVEMLQQSQMDTLKSFSDSIQATTKIATEHTEALANELEISRNYTIQVHKNLVAMTDELATRLGKE